jgi:predicted DNA-binding transcriptional regulator YafY
MAPSAAPRRDRQVVRLLTLLKTLKDGGRPSVHDLAARFHTRRETIYRDLRALQEIGYFVRQPTALGEPAGFRLHDCRHDFCS